MTVAPGAEAGVIGRTLRLMLALLLGLMTYTVMRTEGKAFTLRLLTAVGGVTVGYALLYFVLRRYGTGLHRWYGALGRAAASAYLGLSFLLQTFRGDGGSEVLAVPAALFRRPTHLAGILFAPIDLVEKHLTGPGGLPG
jgi:hypothetical protein